MDNKQYQSLIDSFKPDPSLMDMLRNICQDLDIELKNVQPYWWRLNKLGYTSIDIMTISLTIKLNGKWIMGLEIDEVYNKIKNNFK